MNNLGNREIFAKNLSYYVNRSNRSQLEIAEAVGVAAPTFNTWLKGKKYPRIDKIELLADYFGIRKSDLIEERVTEEMSRDNDTIASIIVRLRSDPEFFNVTERIYHMKSAQVSSVKLMLDTLQTFQK